MYLLRVSDPRALPDVRDFFRRAHVDVREQSVALLSASIPGAPSSQHEWREITGYVATWNALNPGSPLTVVDAPS